MSDLYSFKSVNSIYEFNYRENLDLGLYLVLDPCVAKPKRIENVLNNAIRGGAKIVQVREKICGNEEFASLIKKCQELLRPFHIPLIINDRVDLVKKLQVQGVHLGQSDFSYREARKLLGPNAIIGVSVEERAQILAAEREDIDYLGVSSVFPTETKKNIKKVWGLEGLKEIRKISSHRLVGIGGIDLRNAHQVLEAGADGLAVVGAICKAPSPRRASEAFSKLILQHQRKSAL